MTDKNIQPEVATGVFGVLDPAQREQREQLFRKAMSMHSVQIVAVLEHVATLEERIQRVIDMLKLVEADGVDAALRVLEDEE